jgi:hypothetical protein
LAARCKTLARSSADPMFCAVASYHASWERPDITFANAVMASVAKEDAPNFDMPKDIGIESTDVASGAAPAHPQAAPATSAASSEHRERGWSSALFPAKPQQTDSASTGARSDNPRAEQAPFSDTINALSATVKSPADSLFAPRSSGRRQ